MKTLVGKVKAAFAQVQEDLDGLRDRIGELKGERDRVEALPHDIAEIERRVDREIATARERRSLRYPGFFQAFVVDLTLSGYLKRAFEADQLGFLAAWDPVRLKSVLMEDMPLNGITDADRATRLKKLSDDILATEIAEEVLLREMEASTNAPIFRRTDANPAILLAPDTELS